MDEFANYTFYVFIIIVILGYYCSIMIIYESSQKPIYSLNWPIVIRFLTGTNKSDDSLQKFLLSYCKYNESFLDGGDGGDGGDGTGDGTGDNTGGDGDGDGTGGDDGSNGTGGNGSNGSGSGGRDHYDLSPPLVPSALIVHQWEKDHNQNYDGFENIKPQEKSYNIMNIGNDIYNQIKLQIDNFYMKLSINGKTYITRAKYNL
jgi:hypothetical protein